MTGDDYALPIAINGRCDIKITISKYSIRGGIALTPLSTIACIYREAE